ncbi:MAG: damage-inducible protein, partial [Nitrospina sp.]|nr:damage-inducible protein [Nitrospina sp.]
MGRGNAADGLRKQLHDEFSKIYIFHLRGDQRTSGELSRKEGGKIFGSGSRTPIAITFLVKKLDSTEKGQIYFYDIGDYLDRKHKLAIIQRFKSINGIKEENNFQLLEPDANNDWVNQGERSFGKFIQIGDKSKAVNPKVFTNYSLGVATGRDVWCYNFSVNNLQARIKAFIKFYNTEVKRFGASSKKVSPESFVIRDLTRISWNRNALQDLKKGKEYEFSKANIYKALYRPFSKTNFYFSKQLNAMTYQNFKLFPNPNTINRIISVTGIGSKDGLSTIMSDVIADLNLLKGGAQCFPLRIFEKQEAGDSLFANQSESEDFIVSDVITDDGLQLFLDAYSDKTFKKEDLFYYIYGLLHSPDYRERFQNNLSKELPRIPAVNSFEDFMAFSKAGRKLGDLHVNYETVEPFPVTFKEGDLRLADISDPKSFYRVKKMKFASKQDKATVF